MLRRGPNAHCTESDPPGRGRSERIRPSACPDGGVTPPSGFLVSSFVSSCRRVVVSSCRASFLEETFRYIGKSTSPRQGQLASYRPGEPRVYVGVTSYTPEEPPPLSLIGAARAMFAILSCRTTQPRWSLTRDAGSEVRVALFSNLSCRSRPRPQQSPASGTGIRWRSTCRSRGCGLEGSTVTETFLRPRRCFRRSRHSLTPRSASAQP